MTEMTDEKRKEKKTEAINISVQTRRADQKRIASFLLLEIKERNQYSSWRHNLRTIPKKAQLCISPKQQTSNSKIKHQLKLYRAQTNDN